MLRGSPSLTIAQPSLDCGVGAALKRRRRLLQLSHLAMLRAVGSSLATPRETASRRTCRTHGGPQRSLAVYSRRTNLSCEIDAAKPGCLQECLPASFKYRLKEQATCNLGTGPHRARQTPMASPRSPGRSDLRMLLQRGKLIRLAEWHMRSKRASRVQAARQSAMGRQASNSGRAQLGRVRPRSAIGGLT